MSVMVQSCASPHRATHRSAVRFVWRCCSATADMATPGVAVAYRALLSCVSRAQARACLGTGVGVDLLICLDVRDRGRACARGAGGGRDVLEPPCPVGGGGGVPRPGPPPLLPF